MASGLNTVSGTVYKNFIVNWMPKGTSEKTASNILKLIVIIAGIICSALVFVVDKLGAVLQVAMSFHGLTSGIHLGIFILGMLFPSANATGTIWGAIVSLILTATITFGAQIYAFQGKLKYPPISASTEGCDFSPNITSFANSTITNFSVDDNKQVFWLFRISFYYYPLVGLVCIIVVGLIVSHFTKDEKEKPVDAQLLNPYIYRFLSSKHFSSTPVKYASVKGALQMTQVQDSTCGITEKPSTLQSS
ncbi:sodium-coupled monocarboxylate transporter 2-like isoform X2 [Agrilus planipennis]|nr:sodium-coupled monocarboxylate transporter 2-like isoform X2 [Agrilus planipennis]